MVEVATSLCAVGKSRQHWVAQASHTQEGYVSIDKHGEKRKCIIFVIQDRRLLKRRNYREYRAYLHRSQPTTLVSQTGER
jgi:hypothetical protein